MTRFFISLILLCACVAASSANTKAQELFPRTEASRHMVEALRLNAAQQTNPQANLALAKALYRKSKQRLNHREACRLFEEASTKGSVEATAWLGSCYTYGRGVEKRDIARGVSLIQSAADADDPVGLMFLGVLHMRGRGVARDNAKAADLFSRAVSKGYTPAYAQLGYLYMRGQGVRQDRQKGFELFRQAAQTGDPWSQLRLGQLAFNGFIGSQGEALRLRSNSPNYGMALQLFSQAAAQGNRSAAFRVAQMYESQLGVPQDIKKAVKYYRQSARAGDHRAQLAMGRLSESHGGPRGPIYSYAWYTLAIRQGDAKAGEYLDALRAKMTPGQTQQAEAMLAKWKAKRFCFGCRRKQSASR